MWDMLYKRGKIIYLNLFIGMQCNAMAFRAIRLPVRCGKHMPRSDQWATAIETNLLDNSVSCICSDDIMIHRLTNNSMVRIHQFFFILTALQLLPFAYPKVLSMARLLNFGRKSSLIQLNVIETHYSLFLTIFSWWSADYSFVLNFRISASFFGCKQASLGHRF